VLFLQEICSVVCTTDTKHSVHFFSSEVTYTKIYIQIQTQTCTILDQFPYFSVEEIMQYSLWYSYSASTINMFSVNKPMSYEKWVSYHHDMARTQVVIGGNGLHTYRVAANILNKQSMTANKG
jgi:hypothetical protein